MARILIADDHGIVRAAVRSLLEARPDIEVVGEAATGDAALRLADELCPDLVLLNISMPDQDGIEIARLLRQSQSDLRVLILTASEEKAILTESLNAGACGYVVKRALDSELLGAIDAAMRGDLYLHPSITRALIEDAVKPVEPLTVGAHDAITPREKEVLALIAQGLTNAQIAEKLVLSPRTVESHRANLLAKLQIRGRAGLVRYAVEHDLLPDHQVTNPKGGAR